MQQVVIRKVAVLGAGVMGAQIAAHCRNAGIPVCLFDLSSPEADKSTIARTAIQRLTQLKPAPLGDAYLAEYIQPANYEQDLSLLQDCDLIIEAIAERLEWKYDLYKKVLPYISQHAIFASNTSGIPITVLANGFPEDLKKRFCGVHFFNPPRYMPLVELIPTEFTAPSLLDNLETFLVSVLGKGVVRAFDTPNFIGNRVGMFSILATMIRAEQFDIPYDIADDLTGVHLGRAKSATFRTADVVGLDTLANIIRTMQQSLQEDPFYPKFQMPEALQHLVEHQQLGQKTGAGYFKKVGKEIHQWDHKTRSYVPSNGAADADVIAILKIKDPAQRLQKLRSSSHPQAQFVWTLLSDLFHYIATHLAEIAPSAREVDFAMRWGYGHAVGPFELWQSAGWVQVAEWVLEDIDQQRALVDSPLPEWVFSATVSSHGGVHTAHGSWSAGKQQFVASSQLPVYQKQIFSAPLVGNGVPSAWQSGKTVQETEALRLWTLPDTPYANTLIASIKTKKAVLSSHAITDLQSAISIAEKQYDGLVLWNPDGAFVSGFEPSFLQTVVSAPNAVARQASLNSFYQLLQQLSAAAVPTVMALSGRAIGAGAILALACQKRVAHFESTLGLSEVIPETKTALPIAGALTFALESALRTQQVVSALHPKDLVQSALEQLFSGAMATSGTQLLQKGMLTTGDSIIFNSYEVLYGAFEAVHYANKVRRTPTLPVKLPNLSAQDAQDIEKAVIQRVSIPEGDVRQQWLKAALLALSSASNATSQFAWEMQL